MKIKETAKNKTPERLCYGTMSYWREDERVTNDIPLIDFFRVSPHCAHKSAYIFVHSLTSFLGNINK